jgi:pteridine reductase
MDLSGKVALVTGGAVRIGAAICRELAQRGAHVAIHCHHSVDAAEALRAELSTQTSTTIVTGPLDHPTEAQSVIDATVSALGQIDMLVNNAALFDKGTLRDCTPGDLQHELSVNALVPIELSRAFARAHIAARPGSGAATGCVINLLDRRIACPQTGELAYQLSKRLLSEFTTLAALELAPRIRVNAVAPGAVLPPPGQGDECLHEAAGPAPLQSRCRPEDVAAAVTFLLAQDAITGQTVFVDGGQHLL